MNEDVIVESIPPVEITRDLINDLRLEGRNQDAKRLIQVHLKNMSDEKVQYRKELERNARRITVHNHKVKKICLYCHNNLLDSVHLCHYCKRKKSLVDRIARFLINNNDTGVDMNIIIKSDFNNDRNNIIRYNKKIYNHNMRKNKNKIEGVIKNETTNE